MEKLDYWPETPTVIVIKCLARALDCQRYTIIIIINYRATLCSCGV